MTGSEIFNIISGVITIASFIFAIWVWMRSDLKIKELLGVIRSIDDIAGTAIWETLVSPARDYELRLKQAEKTIGFIESIQKLTEHYATDSKVLYDMSLRMLLDKYVVWTTSMVNEYEAERKLTEIWIVSADLKPDSSDEEIGKIVNKNLKKGVKYIFFCPDNIPHFQAETQRLLKNVNATSKKLNDRVNFILLDRENYNALIADGNIALYFHDEKRSLPPKCFEEILFTQIPERGVFWQEHSEEQANRIRHLLEPKLNEQHKV